MKYAITRRIEFDAGHRVPKHVSKCKNVHGHRYVAEITCSSDELCEEGFVIDFGIVKNVVGGWIQEHWDHTTIYDEHDFLMSDLSKICEEAGHKKWYKLPYAPTAENMAKHLYEIARWLMLSEDPLINVEQITIHETPNCRAVWPMKPYEDV